MKIATGNFTLSVFCSALFAGTAFAADSIGEPGRSAGGKNPLKNVYFGEEHLHTSASPDAFEMPKLVLSPRVPGQWNRLIMSCLRM